MIKTKKKVMEFLKKYGMGFENIDLKQNSKIFTEEMENGLCGRNSSLRMIPTYISMEKEIPIGEPVIAVDAGGTNFRVALVHFDRNRKPVVEGFELFPMPGSKGAILKEEFFETVVQYMGPVLGKSKKIGFSFSYPTEILPNRDGRLIQFCKEVQVQGVEGEIIGQNLLRTMKAMGYENDKKIIMLNDTVATLLAGKASNPDRVFEGYIGFILGTGTNTCYIEETRNIGKVREINALKGSMLINVESGDYRKAPRGVIDSEFDSGTINPGQYTFEKMISGGYQGGLMLSVIRKAVNDNLFSGSFAEKAVLIDELTSKEIDDFLYYPYSENNILARCCNAEKSIKRSNDHMTLYYLMDALAERAGKLVAFNLSAIILKTGKGKNPCAPICVTVDGAAFYKSKLFRGKLDYYIKTYLNEKNQTYCEFVKAENATLIGTAIAGLIN